MRMKRLFCMVLVLFVGVGTGIFAQSTVNTASTKPKLGDKPPLWVKNKVNEAQYDSLATFAKYYIVDYDYFKRRDLTRKDIAFFVARTAEIIKWKKTSSKLPPGVASGFHVYELPRKIKPFGMTPKDAEGQVQFIVYSEIDGWDAHVMLKAKMDTTADGGKRLSELSVVPYSVSGLKVVIESIDFFQQKNHLKVDSIDLDDKGESPVYILRGKMKVEDAMGYWHTEPFDTSVILTVE